MIGNPTFYKNNIRVITGLVNPVFENDVVLLCDTSLGAVNLTLLEIPLDRFSTQYKLYVVDKSNNAGVNNITITAPSGFSVNNSSTAVINVNNGVATITISSNLTYNAQYNYIVGGGGAIVVKNEGTIITSNATSFDFVGADVNATAIGGDVTINVQSSFVLVTYAQLQTLVSTNALVPSQEYLVSDAIFINTNGIQYVPIVIEAITTNKVTLSGSGIFLNADYQKVGNYSGVSGFVNQLGVWDLVFTPVIGDVVIWNNSHWVNLTGANGGSPDTTPLDWSLLSKSLTNGYIQEVDIIKYNSVTNQITYREDVRNNRIENNLQTFVFNLEAFSVFQWGNDGVDNNSVFGESSFEIWNNMGKTISYNFLSNNSIFTFSNPNTSSFIGNTANNNCTIAVIVCDGLIRSNSFESIDMHISTETNTCSIQRNIFKYGAGHSVICKVNQAKIYENTIYGGATPFSFVNEKDFYNNTILFCTFIIGSNNGYINNNNLQYSSVNIFENKGNFTDNIILSSKFSCQTNLGDILSNNINEESTFIVTLTQIGSAITLNNLFSRSVVQIQDNFNIFSNNNLSGGSSLNLATNNANLNDNVFNKSNVKLANNNSFFTLNQFTLVTIAFQDLLDSFTKNIWVNVNFNLSGNFASELSGTFVENGTLFGTTLLTKIIGGVFQNNIGTIIYPLNMTDPTIYDVATKTLTIPVGLKDFIGEFWLFFGGNIDFENIQNLNQNFATKFVNKEIGTIKTFKTLNSVTFSLLDQIISSTLAPALFRLTGRANGEDSIYIRRLGNFNGIEQTYIYN